VFRKLPLRFGGKRRRGCIPNIVGPAIRDICAHSIAIAAEWAGG
jgi:hypothetical protein